MSDQFVGCTVSIKCVDDLGAYQGQIIDFNEHTVTLSKPFFNGTPYSEPRVTLKAKDISSIEIISTEESSGNDNESQIQSKVTVKRPIAKRVGRSCSECATCMPTSVGAASSISCPSNKEAQADSAQAEPSTNGRTFTHFANTAISDLESLQNAKKHIKSRKQWTERDEEAFGTPIDQSMEQDFDFEKNLALFNKKALWQQMRKSKSNKKIYRHDENVIESEPTAFRQIVIPRKSIDNKEYVTDDGLVIPSITLDLHKQLIGAADRFGISWERRVELLGRAATEISLQLLGGGHRFNPNNAHQWPTVVALCGPHRSGAAGVNSARQLSSHGVKTYVYYEKSDNIFLLQELSLYKLTGNPVETDIKKLPQTVDLILVALCEDNSSTQNVTPVARWVQNNRALILAIEPPSTGTPGIISKFSLLGGLPLAHNESNGRLYLCNLALPDRIFADVGINYRSPFGPKFVIPLYTNSS